MEYDYRTRAGPPSPYDSPIPMYRQRSSSSSTAPPQSSNNPMYGQQLYPSVGQPPYGAPSHPPPNRTPSSHHHQPSAPASAGMGIRVALKPEYRITPPGSITDPIERKFIVAGLSREAVPFAVATYGDDPTKVEEFVKGYNLLREMGFSSNNVAEALAMFDNDTDKALAHFLNSST